MALHKDIAVVLRRLDYSETSQVLAVFTQTHGQERVIAKGIKRSTKTKVAVGVDLLECGRIVYSRRPGNDEGLATMTEWHQEEHFPHIRRDLLRYYLAQYGAEVTSSLTELHDPHPDLFDHLVAFLRGLTGQTPLDGLNAYLWLMLTEIGLRPDLKHCTDCRRPVDSAELCYFSSRQGGLICRDCEPNHIEKRRMSRLVIESLLAIQSCEVDTTQHGANGGPPGFSQVVFELLDYHLTEILSRPPKLSSPLKELLKQSR